MSQNGAHVRKKTGRKKRKSAAGKILLIILALLLVILAVGYAVFHSLYSQLNSKSGARATPTPQVQVTADPAATPGSGTPEPEATEEPEVTEEPEETPRPLTEEEQRALEENELRASLEKDAEEIMYNENVYNMLLIGADGTGDTLERSDAMLLLSINKATKEIWITSFMRDTQVTIPGWGPGQHLNWATQFGGEENGVQLLIDTLESEKNFAIHIDNWAMVNFLDFGEVAGMLGPITVSVTSDEAKSMNHLIRQVCQMRDKYYGLEGENTTPRSLFKTRKDGTYTITDGIQILAYCRERSTTRTALGRFGDTGRSIKQRKVQEDMWENVKKMSLKQQYDVAKAAMSIITTDLTERQCFSLLLMAPTLKDYVIYNQQIPYEDAMNKGLNANGLSTYFPDLKVNRNILRATIYGEEVSQADLHSSYTGKTVVLPNAK